jgi:mono/diheme cytochrome c family protein
MFLLVRAMTANPSAGKPGWRGEARGPVAFCLALGWLAAGLVSTAEAAPAPQVDFLKDIQPILAGHCYSCHGPEKQKGDLRWDSKESVFKAGEHGPVIVPRNSAKSRVMVLVSGQDPDLLMPPRGERLTSAQINLLRSWIDQGASWPEEASLSSGNKANHWAFKAPVRPAIPAVKNKKWVRNPIDDFVLARLDKERLRPSAVADKATLVRRVSLDLTGLPPTPKEVEKFLADHRPSAYEDLVERLLRSPHYGEMWGRHWLDVARYADTNGYEKDRPRSIWPYRDWVIRALNRDEPFDQFTIEQLAGDLLPSPTLEQRVATGFLRNSMLNQEGGIEPEQFRVEALIDRMDTLGKAFLGLTINCCQCHNHKFDPFSQKEYYQLLAFLNNDDEAYAEVPSPEQQAQRGRILAKVRALEDKAMVSTTNLAERMAAWENDVSDASGDWTVLDPKEWFSFAAKFEKQDDGSLLGGGDLEPGGVVRVWAETTLTNITGFRLEALTNPNLIYGGPGIMGKGSFLLKEFVVEACALHDPTVTNRIKFRRALADQQAPGFSITNAIDGNTEKGGWTPALSPDRRNQNHLAVFECAEPIGFPGGTRLLFTLHENFDGDSKLDCHLLGCLRLSATTRGAPLKADPLSDRQRSVLAVAPAQRTPEQRIALFEAFRLNAPECADLNRQIDALWSDWPNAPTTLVLQPRPHPRVTHLFKRGDRLRPGEEVAADVPAILNPFPAGAPRNRLGLAKWIVDPRNPTAARAAVNRIWQEYFGQGLVTTPEDFGTRVETPSNPELLDWLASEFMQPTVPDGTNDLAASVRGTGLPRPWSLKHIHWLIVNSATYRQSSKVTPELYAKDQFNRLLARGPRFRVQAEVVQDIALSASGLLNPKVGGPSVYPPIPDSVGDTSYGGFSWPQTTGADRYRRGLYTFWKRSLPFPSLNAFDDPSGETSCPRRARSNTPLQALTTLNEKTFVEAAQAMAARVLKEGGADNRTRAAYAFELCTARKPDPADLASLLKFWQEQFDYFENHTASAVQAALPNPSQMPPDMNLHKLAAWAMVSRAILNLDETVTKE